MTKDREFWRYAFAGQAMTSILTKLVGAQDQEVGYLLKPTAEAATNVADALLAALEASAPALDPFEQARKYPCKHGMRYLKGAETCRYNCFGDWPLVVKECEHKWSHEAGQYYLCLRCNKTTLEHVECD